MNNRLISSLALIVSLASLGYAIWLHQHTEALVQQALHQREVELVKEFTPAVKEVYEGFGISKSDVPESPNTFEELFKPVQKMSKMVSPR